MKKNRNIPFGYCIKDGKYTVNEKEAEVVKHIFNEYLKGKSLSVIASEMTVSYNSSKPIWNKNMVKRVLENRRYIGEKGFTQIISKEDFENVERIKSKKKTKISTKSQPMQSSLQQEIVYEPDDDIMLLTKEIHRLLENDKFDKEKVKSLIFKCAVKKYHCCKIR